METTIRRRTNRQSLTRSKIISAAPVISLQEDGQNKVVIENGEVKTLLYTDTVTPEEARQLLYDMIDLEYSLP